MKYGNFCGEGVGVGVIFVPRVVLLWNYNPTLNWVLNFVEV